MGAWDASHSAPTPPPEAFRDGDGTMSGHLEAATRHDPSTGSTPTALFAWSGGGIVLLAERSAERWTLARGWRHGDRLDHVRRWSFADPRAFVGQVRRLVGDATGDPAAALAASADAARWARTLG